MGAFLSSQEGGYNKEKVDKTDISAKIDKMLTHMLDEHMSDFVNKNFCKKAKLFIRDEVLMKQAEGDIGKLHEQIIIGKSIGGADTKPEICERLSHHFLKKINLVASVNMVIKTGNDRLDALKKGGQCFSEKANSVSNIKYQPIFMGANNLHYNKLKTPYHFSKRHVLEVDSDQVRKMAFDKLQKDKRGGKILKTTGEQTFLPEKSRSHLLVREITKPDICQTNGGKWLRTEEDLIKHGLKPNRGVSNYNKGWNEIVNTTENNLVNDSNKLFKILNEVMYESVQEIDGLKQKKYIGKPISDKRLGELISDSKKIIYNILSDIDKTYLLTSSIPLVSSGEIEQQKKLEEEKKK